MVCFHYIIELQSNNNSQALCVKTLLLSLFEWLLFDCMTFLRWMKNHLHCTVVRFRWDGEEGVGPVKFAIILRVTRVTRRSRSVSTSRAAVGEQLCFVVVFGFLNHGVLDNEANQVEARRVSNERIFYPFIITCIIGVVDPKPKYINTKIRNLRSIWTWGRIIFARSIEGSNYQI